MIQGTANIVFAFNTSEESKFHPYLIGGVGGYNVKAVGDDVEGADSETNFGVNAGAGFDFDLGNLAAFVEGDSTPSSVAPWIPRPWMTRPRASSRSPSAFDWVAAAEPVQSRSGAPVTGRRFLLRRAPRRWGVIPRQTAIAP